MKDFNGGCCGHPQTCQGSTDGRCKAREEFEQARKPKRRGFEAVFGGDENAIAKARAIQAEQAKRNKARTRGRDHGIGRTR